VETSAPEAVVAVILSVVAYLGQGTAPNYAMSISEEKRIALRDHHHHCIALMDIAV
jgi:hypothetical protein